jgi:hypothetical protein
MQGHKISGILSLTTHGKHPNYVRIQFLTRGLKLELSCGLIKQMMVHPHLPHHAGVDYISLLAACKL